MPRGYFSEGNSRYAYADTLGYFAAVEPFAESPAPKAKSGVRFAKRSMKYCAVSGELPLSGVILSLKSDQCSFAQSKSYFFWCTNFRHLRTSEMRKFVHQKKYD